MFRHHQSSALHLPTILMRLIAVLAVLAVVAAGCSSSSDSVSETSASDGAAGDGGSSDDGTSGDDDSSSSSDDGGDDGAGGGEGAPAPTATVADDDDATESADDGDAAMAEDDGEAMAEEAGDGGGDDAMVEDDGESEVAAAPDEDIDFEFESDPPEALEEVLPEPLPEPDPVPAPRPQSGLLTAGEIDDNLNFDFFVGYLDRTAQNANQALPQVDLNDGFTVNVVDQAGVGVANTPVTVTGGDQSFRAFTNSAGVARVFPAYYGITQWESLQVQASGNEIAVSRQDVGNNVEVVANNAEGGAPTALDVALVLDVTGSMSDELNYLTVEFEAIVQRVRDSYPEADLRFGLVAYRDEGDTFVTRAYDFTGDVAQMRQQLADQSADGGGDFPEAMDAALVDANALQWREGNVGRLILLNADAPPHGNRIAATLAEARQAADVGVRIYPLAASGVDEGAEYLMRVMAATTGGRHLFLTEDSGIGGAKLEPKTECYQVTRLDNLLMRVIKAELAGERVDAAEVDIIREVGNFDRGVCVEQ